MPAKDRRLNATGNAGGKPKAGTRSHTPFGFRIWIGVVIGLLLSCHLIPSRGAATDIAPSNAAPRAELDPWLKAIESDWAEAAKAVTNQSKPGATNRPAEPQVNPVLVQSAADIASSNLTVSVHEPKSRPTKQQYLLQLEVARRERLRNEFDQASQTLMTLLESEAPDEFKRAALLELAIIAQGQNEPAKAQRVYAAYLERYPADPSAPEIMLRQGLLYRQMGSTQLALSKFYAVMTATLRLGVESFETYRRLVLMAQTEIADTFYQQGKYEESADFFQRLLKLEAPTLSKPTIHYKLVRSLAQLNHKDEGIVQAEEFLRKYSGAPEEPEVRFLLATMLDQLGRTPEALQQVMALLKTQQSNAGSSPDTWHYWQQRTGKEIARKLCQEGDYLHAMDIYLALLPLNQTPSWQFPLQYDIALIYERLKQPQKAIACYASIVERERELPADASPALREAVSMAKWRKDFLSWHSKAEKDSHEVIAASSQNEPPKATQ